MPSFAPSPLMSAGTAGTSTSNQFRRANLRGARNKYIDTLNPTSSASNSTAPSPALGTRIPPPPSFGSLGDLNDATAAPIDPSSSRRNSSGNVYSNKDMQ